MGLWVLKLKCTDEDRPNEVLSFHETEEAAQREACYQFLKLGLSAMDAEDEDHRSIAIPFLAHVYNGNFALALQVYQKGIDKEDWEDSFEIYRAGLKLGADSPLLAAAQSEQVRWDAAKEDDEDDDADDCAEGG